MFIAYYPHSIYMLDLLLNLQSLDLSFFWLFLWLYFLFFYPGNWSEYDITITLSQVTVMVTGHKVAMEESRRFLSKTTRSRLNIPIFFSPFLFYSIHFMVFLFLELGLGLEWQGHMVTWQIKWHRRFWKKWHHTTCNIYGHLG